MTDARKTPRAPEPTQALFVRIPTQHARRLDRAAFELRRPKQALVSELVERYIDDVAEAGRRRVTVETLEPDALVVGHHSFRSREPERSSAHAPAVLRSEQAAELLQVDAQIVEKLAEAGELPGRKLAGEWRFSRAALLRWLARDSGADPSEPGVDERVFGADASGSGGIGDSGGEAGGGVAGGR
jgi:excisionase family DNA binding protein